MIDVDYQYRRLLMKEELDEVYELIAEEPEFTNHYPNHREWLRKSLAEVYEGNRLAYGLLKSITEEGQACLKLVGVVIVKLTEPIAELKSLFLPVWQSNCG